MISPRVRSTVPQLLKLAAAVGMVAGLALGLVRLRQASAPKESAEREKRYNKVIGDETPDADDVIEAADAPAEAHRADDGANRSFHEVAQPVPFRTVQAGGKTLLAIADSGNPEYELVEGEALWISEDGGRSWTRFEDGRDS